MPKIYDDTIWVLSAGETVAGAVVGTGQTITELIAITGATVANITVSAGGSVSAGTATGIVLKPGISDNNRTWFVVGFENTGFYPDDPTRYFSGTASGTVISGPYAIEFVQDGTATGTVVSSGGVQSLGDWLFGQTGTAISTIVSSGGLQRVFNGVASGTTVLDGGQLDVTIGSAISASVASGGSLTVDGIWIGPAATQVFSSGTAISTIASGGSITVTSAGTTVNSILYFDVGTSGSGDTLWAQLLQSDGSLTGWRRFTVSVPRPSMAVSSVANATSGQVINLTSLVTISDPGHASFQKLELWDSKGFVGGQFVVNGVPRAAGQEIDLSAADVANTVFDAGTIGGTDTLWAQLAQNDGTLSGWMKFTVTVPTPSLGVSGVANATAGQAVNLTSLVTITDPGTVGFQKLELWQSQGSGGGGHFVVNGAPQTAGHEIDLSPADVAGTVFDAATSGGTDILWAQLVQGDGTLSGWKQFSVTVPSPSLAVSSIGNATGGEVINLASLVAITDAGHAGFRKLELWDSQGTVSGGQFVVNNAPQTGRHTIDVNPADLATTVFDAGTAGGADTLWAQLVQNDGSLSGWRQFAVTVPMPTLTVHDDNTATPGQAINLSTFVTVADPSGVGFLKLQLWDSIGSAAGGQFVVNGAPQTGGHAIDVSSADVTHTVFDEGTAGTTDTLWARLQQNDGTLTGWRKFSVGPTTG